LVRRLGWLQTQSGHDGKDKSSHLCRKLNPGHPAHSLITVLTEVSCLLCINRRKIARNKGES
jgi:hypothetical protein